MTPTSRSVPCLSPASFLWPDRLVWSGWIEHVPFAFWLVEAIEPRVLVELGTHTGASFSAFCQTVQMGNGDCYCHAVDTWQGDKHAGAYAETVFEEVRDYLLPRYGDFATLHRATFDEALSHFADGSVDLLHIDGLHTYEAVRHDFESWRPKLSDRAVVLFHDTVVRRDDFGVYRLWEELEGAFPSFEFQHGNGLGVIAVGEVPEGLAPLIALGGDPAAADLVRKTYHVLGDRLTRALIEADKSRENTRLSEAVETYRGQLLHRTQQLEAYIARTKKLEGALMSQQQMNPTESAAPARAAEIIVHEFENLRDFVAFRQRSPDYFSESSIKADGDLIGMQGIYCNVFKEAAPPRDVTIHNENYRETIVYRGFNSRMRAVHHVFETATAHFPQNDLKVFAPEAVSAYAMYMRGRNAKFIGSEYTTDPKIREYLFPIPIEDLHALSFGEQAFHAIFVNEVFEHVPYLDKALSELARVLKVGGKLISTFPFLGFSEESVVRAKLENGAIVHLTDPEYHGNPVDPTGGSLVFELPGWNILDRIRAAGFKRAAMQWVYSIDCGILAPGYGGVLVLLAEK